MLVDDLTLLSHIIGNTPFQEQSEALKSSILTAILTGSEATTQSHAESSNRPRNAEQLRTSTSSGSNDKHGKIEILASITHDVYTGKTEVHPSWLRDFKDILFPIAREADDHDLRSDAVAVPARNPSLDHDDQSQGSSSVRSWRTAFMNIREVKEETQNMKLRVVDPLEDEGVWVIVDDAWNSCCHGSEWCKMPQDTSSMELVRRTLYPEENTGCHAHCILLSPS